MDDRSASAGLVAFVLQWRLEHPPAGIEHGLRHPGLDQLEATHIANDYGLVLLNDPPTELVEGIGASPGGPPMQAFRLPSVSAALGHGNGGFEAAVVPSFLESFAFARDRRLSQA